MISGNERRQPEKLAQDTRGHGHDARRTRHQHPPLTMNLPSCIPMTDLRHLLIDARDLVRHAPMTSQYLLHPVSLQLHDGDRVAVTGPSGAGKSVLLRLLALLDEPDGGEIHWRGALVSRRTIPAYRRSVAYLKQRAAMLDGSVADNLHAPFALKIYNDLHYSHEAILDLLTAAGRDASFLAKKAGELSGGEAQIAALIRVLQLAPTVLLLDEPTASLDPASAAIVEAMVDQWFTAMPGRALAWVSHDPAQAARVSNQTLQLQAGWVQQGNPPR
jgi:putative ABC transport system ATP-binding protein